MALSTTNDYALAINQILWAQEKNRGTLFPFNEIVRDGGMSEADALTLRTAYLTYKQTREARPAFTPAHSDKAADIDMVNQLGRSGRGDGSTGDVPSPTNTTQTGR